MFVCCDRVCFRRTCVRACLFVVIVCTYVCEGLCLFAVIGCTYVCVGELFVCCDRVCFRRKCEGVCVCVCTETQITTSLRQELATKSHARSINRKHERTWSRYGSRRVTCSLARDWLSFPFLFLILPPLRKSYRLSLFLLPLLYTLRWTIMHIIKLFVHILFGAIIKT